MPKYLVIVESPAKVKTIKKFLGANYEVAASNGHVRDLPKSSLGIDVENDYEPKYITIRGKGDVLANLRKLVKKSDKIYLATDPDREGEAISWHLAQALKIEDKDRLRSRQQRRAISYFPRSIRSEPQVRLTELLTCFRRISNSRSVSSWQWCSKRSYHSSFCRQLINHAGLVHLRSCL